MVTDLRVSFIICHFKFKSLETICKRIIITNEYDSLHEILAYVTTHREYHFSVSDVLRMNRFFWNLYETHATQFFRDHALDRVQSIDLSFACVRIRHFGDTDSSTVFCPHLDTSSSTLPTHVIVIMSIIGMLLRDQYLVVLFVIINRVSFDFRSEWSPGLSHMFGLSPWEHRYLHIQELSNGKRCVLEILFQFILSRRVTSFVWHNLKLQIRNDLQWYLKYLWNNFVFDDLTRRRNVWVRYIISCIVSSFLQKTDVIHPVWRQRALQYVAFFTFLLFF